MIRADYYVEFLTFFKTFNYVNNNRVEVKSIHNQVFGRLVPTYLKFIFSLKLQLENLYINGLTIYLLYYTPTFLLPRMYMIDGNQQQNI